jgi:phthiocerol/phenolphthiocerol synthesis type-I polyketide synthase E
VGELDARVAALSAGRRRLLRRLAAQPPEARKVPEGGGGPQAAAASQAAPGIAGFYDAITARLDATSAGPWAVFLNYGYCDGDNDQAAVAVPERTVDRTSVKLVVELVGNRPLDGCRVLDVGCGRGGTIATLLRYFRPREVVGVDISPAAISFCRRSQHDHRARFEIGDAQHLPFPDASFDVVTNVESSHCYPDVGSFYAEVRRVLSPGGTFLYTDLLTTSSLPARRAALSRLGLRLETERDVTANVVRSCDLVAARRSAAFAGAGEGGLDDFLAVPGSVHYERMRSGAATYIIWQLRTMP